MFKLLLTTAIALTIAGCGGGGGGAAAPTTATGQFKDSNTSGLNYVSGAQSGVTATDGSFTYEIGKTVTFSVGGVTLGTSSGKSVVTPVDLVTSGSSSSTSVQNIARFLMMLDTDANPANGINISASVQAVAATWTPLDFSSATFDTAASAVIASVSSADSRVASLPTANAAQLHLESTLRCSYAGGYKGTYTGTDSGNFGVMVDASSGTVLGVGYSNGNQQNFSISGTTPISYNQNASFVSGFAGTGTYTGQFTSVNSMSGTWLDTLNSGHGNFSGSRIGGGLNAVYRFTGVFSGNGFGLFTFDIDSANKGTGVGYNVVNGQLVTLTGTLAGTTLTASSSDGASITGTLNTVAGTLSGNWSNAGNSGTFSGSGCRLN